MLINNIKLIQSPKGEPLVSNIVLIQSQKREPLVSNIIIILGETRLLHVYARLSTVIVYVLKNELSHLLADAEARSLVSDSFPKMHINNKIYVSVKAMCRVAAKKLLNKAL